MAYFTLVTKQDGKWYPQFGDHERTVVADERIEYRGFETKIIKTQSSRQFLIDREIAELNRREALKGRGKLSTVKG